MASQHYFNLGSYKHSAITYITPAVNEDVRVALLSCLPPYLSRCASAPDAASLSFLALGTRDAKEATRKACLKAAGATLLAAPRTRWVRVTVKP